MEAVAVDISNLNSNYSGTAKLQAVDSDGNVLPVVLSETEAIFKSLLHKQNKEWKMGKYFAMDGVRGEAT